MEFMSFQNIEGSGEFSNIINKKKHKNSQKRINPDLILYPYSQKQSSNKIFTLKKIDFIPIDYLKSKSIQNNSTTLSQNKKDSNFNKKDFSKPSIFNENKQVELNKDTGSIFQTASIFNISQDSTKTSDTDRSFYSTRQRKEIIEIANKEITLNFNFVKEDWLLWLILGGILVFIGVKIFFKKILSETFQSIYINNTSNRLFRERNQVFLISSTILKTIFSVNIGIFTFLTLNEFSLHFERFTPFQETLFFILLWASSYTVKYIFFITIGYLTNTNNYLKLYMHNTAILNKVYGILLFPIIFSILYLNQNIISTKALIYGGWSLFLLFFIIRLSKGLLICIRQKVYLFYTILYLCALEIIPQIIIYKLILLIGMSSIS